MFPISQKFKTLLYHPQAAFSKYTKRTYFKIIGAPTPYTDENYNRHWAFTDFKGKAILDLGADYGSTAWFFIHKGAESVVALEGDHGRAKKLAMNATKFGFTSFEKMVSCSADIEELLQKYRFDVAKVDIEGAEAHLIECNEELLKAVPFWMIETHSSALTSSVTNRFEELGFEVKEINDNTGLVVLVIQKPQRISQSLNA